MEKEFSEASSKVMRILDVLEEKKNLGEASVMAKELLSFLELCQAKSRDVVTLPFKRKRKEDKVDDKYQDCRKTKTAPRPKYTAGYGGISRCQSEEQVHYYMRRKRGYEANQFWFGCTFDSVLKTCIQGPGCIYPCLDNSSFGITWVAVQAMDNTIAVVTRQRDLDMTRVNSFRQTQPKKQVITALHQALTSEVECLPYDDDDIFLEGPSTSIKKPFSVGRLIGEKIRKPFSVVSVYPVPENCEEAGQQISSVEYDGDKAINFLMGKMDSELVATIDDAVKIAISGFKHLCLKDLKAEEYWVSKWNGKCSFLQHLSPEQIDEYLAVISGKMTA